MKKQTIGVVGLGNFGSTVATELMRFGNEVIGVDFNESVVSAHADKLSFVLIADVRDENALKEAGLGNCGTVLVGLGSDLESSIVCVINLKLLGVQRIWAKAATKTHHRILSKLGVDRVIHPEVEVGQQIAQVLHNPMVRDYVSLGNGFYVVSFRIPEKLEGKNLADMKHDTKYDLRCVGAMRGTEFIGQDGDNCTLQRDDYLMLLGKRQNLREFAESIS